MQLAVNRSLAASLAAVLLVMACGSPLLAQPAADQPTKPKAEPKWVHSINVAMAEALRTNRLVLAYFRGNSVGACVSMEQITFSHPAVLAQTTDIVMVKQDVERDEAARQFASARKVDIQLLPALIWLKPDGSEVHRFQGRFASPQDVFNMIRVVKSWWEARRKADQNPKDVMAFKNAARWRLSLTTRRQARGALEKVLELDPAGKQVHLDQVYLWLSRIHAQKPTTTKEDLAKATDYATKAINCNIENLGGITGASLELLGSIALQNKEYDLAEKRFRKMIEVDPKDRWGQGSIGLYRLAMMAGQRKQTDKAIWLLDQIVATYPFGRFAFQSIAAKARTLADKEDLSGAIKTLQKAIELWPNSKAAQQAERDINQLKQSLATRAAGVKPKAP